MTFKEYLISRRIDPSGFAKNEPRRYREFGLLFDQVHLKSFVMQKLFLLNPLRTKYPYQVEASTKNQRGTSASTGQLKPKIVSIAARKSAENKPLTKPVMPQAKKVEDSTDEKIVKPSRPVIKPKLSSEKTAKAVSGEGSKNVKPKIRPRPIIKKK